MNQTGDQNVEATVDVGAQRVARVYAEALLNAAEKRGQAAEILEQLDSLVRDVLSKDPQLEAFLSSHAVGRDKKAGVIRSVFDNRASELFVSFLQLLNEHE